MSVKFNSRNPKTKLNKPSRFKRTRFDDEKIKNFNFESGLISKDIKECDFINFAVDEDDEAYNYVINYYIDYLDDNYTFINKDFVMNEDKLNPQSDRVKRLLEILGNVQGRGYPLKDSQYILKMKCVKYPKLHFYFWKSRENLKLILIDLYHLGIYSAKYDKGKVVNISLRSIYKRYRNNKKDLADIKQLSEKETVNS